MRNVVLEQNEMMQREGAIKRELEAADKRAE